MQDLHVADKVGKKSRWPHIQLKIEIGTDVEVKSKLKFVRVEYEE